MNDFSGHAKGLSSPADEHFTITADDNNDLSVIPRCLYVNTAGLVVIRDKKGVDITYNVNVGVLQIRPVRVLTSTTAELIGWS